MRYRKTWFIHSFLPVVAGLGGTEEDNIRTSVWGQTVGLENKVLWVIADLELKRHWSWCLRDDRVSGQIRDELRVTRGGNFKWVSWRSYWRDHDELKGYLNTMFSLKSNRYRQRMSASSPRCETRSIMESVMRYRSLEKTVVDIERYLSW